MDHDDNSKRTEPVCPGKKLDLVQVQQRIQQTTGPEYWRSLEELAQSQEVREMMHREFPRGASEWLDGISRRGFLQLMSASLALAGMTACTKQPLEPIVPYVRQPEEILPGIPMYFATAMTLGGYALPLLAKSNMGRPTKLEGNPQHPASLGGSDIFSQASILDLYDPDRSQTITYLGEVRTWAGFLGAVRGPLAVQKPLQGGGIRILTQAISSPTLSSQLQSFLKAFPAARWHQWEAANRDNVLAGAQMAFGQPLETQYRLEGADIIVSLDADFLYGGFPGFTRYARDYSFRRRPDSDRPMNRMYVVESSTTSTGAKADHRLALRASDVEQFARALASGLGVNGGGSNAQFGNFLSVLIKDLQQHRGASVIIVGDDQGPIVHALAHAMNQALGNVGKTVVYTDPVNANPTDNRQSIKELAADMDAGKVDVLLILGGNPAYDAPADLKFADLLRSTKVPLRIHLGRYHDETAQLCHWHINQTHYLEEWSDARAYDGTASIVQPLIAPLYDGKSAHELIAVLEGQGQTPGYDLVRAYWQAQFQGSKGAPAKIQTPGAAPGQTQPTPEFEVFWRTSVHDGLIANSAFPVRQVALKATNFPVSSAPNGQGIEVNFRRDPGVYDGRFSNNGWLQELPKPMTKLTWDNPLLVSPKTAEKLHLNKEHVVALEYQGRKIEGAIWIQAGHPEDCITAFLGYGRWRSGRAGTGAGFNVYPLRTSAQLWSINGVQVSKTGGSFEFASVQGQQSIDTELGTRKTVLHVATLDQYKKDPRFAHEEDVEEPDHDYTLYPNYPYNGYKWGMSIDMNSCVGCNACIVACQSENNIAVVGKEQVKLGRHMHWIRVDAYYQGDRDNPKMYFMPVPCQQCEDAPCEVVCPVGATVHSSEGLNDMVYNRCVGTRYCSNNCPYKVRRFNFLLFQDWTIPQFKMARNPDVTVRSRGVMEKCTYCIQRITRARIDSEREDRKIRDGELQTACQQACPANAIIFGDLNTKDAEVTRLKQSPRDYTLLADLNTRPRTTYLANVRNPSPELDGQPEMK